MPELPEVERARKLIADSLTGYKIVHVDAQEDKIVYTGGTDHTEFVKELQGRTIEGCERKGKNFWLKLSGKGRLPVLHFGMTGMIQLKGQEPTWYRRRPKESSSDWPPRFCKFTLDCESQPGAVGEEPRALAFMDGRRLGRIRLLPDPVLEHKPLSALGFDPILSYPTLDEFKTLLSKKKGTVKGMIMDQSFSAGVGNWVADEILYQARIHPACPTNQLSEQNVADLHRQLHVVPTKAVEVNADSTMFPDDWLFRWRWSKGKKETKAKKRAAEDEDDASLGDLKPKGLDFLPLPSGKPATIDFIEVGGRTTAIVKELQKMPEGVEIKPKVSKGGKGSGKKRKGADNDSDTPSESDNESELEDKPKATTPRQRAAAERKADAQQVKTEAESPVKKARKTNGRQADPGPAKRSSRGAKVKAVKPELESAESSDLSDAP